MHDRTHKLVGDLYTKEERDVLFEFKVVTLTSPTNKPSPHATISLASTDTLEKRLQVDGEEDILNTYYYIYNIF